jgi:hypothetical protein
MCKVAHFGGRLTAKTNSKKNAAMDALVVPAKTVGGNQGIRNFSTLYQFYAEARFIHQIANVCLADILPGAMTLLYESGFNHAPAMQVLLEMIECWHGHQPMLNRAGIGSNVVFISVPEECATVGFSAFFQPFVVTAKAVMGS